MGTAELLYDAFEIHKVCEFHDRDMNRYEEIVDEDFQLRDDEDAIRMFWTVYGHLPSGGVEGLVDRDEKYEAEEVLAFFEACLKAYQVQAEFVPAAKLALEKCPFPVGAMRAKEALRSVLAKAQ